MTGPTVEQQEVAAAVKASPELASILSKMLKDAANNPAMLAQHLTRNLRDALSTLPQARESAPEPLIDHKQIQNHAEHGADLQPGMPDALNGEALATIRQEAFEEGLQKSIIAFGHSIKTLSGGISGPQRKWVFPKEYASKFEAQGIDYEVTPVPQLLKALGTTIRFWSWGNSLDDLGIDSERFPNSLAEIISKACEVAYSGKLAGMHARIDMSSEGSLRRLQRVAGITTRLEGLSDFAVNKSLFDLEFDGEIDDRDARKQLGAIIRMTSVIASAIDGAAFPKEIGKEPVVSFSAAVTSGNRLRMTICSEQNHDIEFDADRELGQAGHVGMTTTQLLNFLAKGSLYDLNATVSEPLITEHQYSASFEFDVPKWIVPPAAQ